jgi:hypothetical protein
MTDDEQQMVDAIIRYVKFVRGGNEEETALCLTAIRALNEFFENIRRIADATEKLAELQREDRDMSAENSRDIMRYIQLNMRTDQ